MVHRDILDHEDRGMIAPIDVPPPVATAPARSSLRASRLTRRVRGRVVPW